MHTHKVDVPKPNATIIRTQAFECYVIKCGYKNWHKKHVFKSDWTMCSKYTNHLGSIVHMIVGRGGGMYDHSMRRK